MGSRPGLRLLLVMSLVMAISGAAGAFAAGGRFQRATPADDPTCVEPAPSDDGVAQDTDGDEDVEGDEDTETPDESDTDETCEAPDEDEDGDVEDAGDDDPAVDAEREAECATAAGWEDGVPTAPEGEKLTGIANAMAHVYENCLKNPDAPGLVNALERLAANAARHEAHEAEKAARAAERAAEKAAREAERAARKAERDAAKAERDAEHAAAGHGNPHD